MIPVENLIPVQLVPVRVHPGSYLSPCICLHDTGEKTPPKEAEPIALRSVVFPNKESEAIIILKPICDRLLEAWSALTFG